MISVTTQWNPKQNLLKEIILKPEKFAEAITLCLDMHSWVHASEMSQTDVKTFEDELWDGLSEEAFRHKPAVKCVTIAWNIWHLARIEDITVNILVADGIQVINSGHWLEQMQVTVCDTGNAMTDREIISFSSAVNMNALRNYRIAVGQKTRDIIKQLKPNDLKRKMESCRLQRILDEGGILEVEESKWLIEFWGKKTVAGILLMPVTRHQIVHINDSLRLKEKYLKK